MSRLPMETILRLAVGPLPDEVVEILTQARHENFGSGQRTALRTSSGYPDLPLVVHDLGGTGWLIQVPGYNDARVMLLPEPLDQAIRTARSEGADWLCLDVLREDPVHRRLIGLR